MPYSYQSPTPGEHRVTLPQLLVVRNRQAFREDVVAMIEAGARRIVIDATKCIEIDSSGMGALVRIRKALHTAGGGEMVIVGLCAEMRQRLALCAIDTLFQFADDDAQTTEAA